MRRRVDCHACRYYYVTWDERFAHGCRRMGFKSSRYPGDEVRRVMQGESCRLFEPRLRAAPPTKSKSECRVGVGVGEKEVTSKE